MRYSRSLQFRVTAAFLVFVSLTTSLFAVGIYIANDYLEDSVLDDALRQQADEFERDYAPDHDARLPYSTALKSYLTGTIGGAELPADLQALEPGIHHDLSVGGKTSDILVRSIHGQRLYLVYDTSEIDQRQSILIVCLFIGVALASLSAALLGYLLSRTAIRPVTALAERVTHLKPNERDVVLNEDFAGHEVGTIAQAFDLFLHRLHDFIERERAFTEDASHELRTPIAVIASASELLLADAKTPEQVRPALQRIARAAEQMRRSTHALLFLARESGLAMDEQERCRVDLVVSEVIEAQRSVAESKSLRIEIGTLAQLEVKASADLVTIVLTNLLQNAIEHTETGCVTVSVLGDTLSVTDTGRGIPEEDQRRLFDRHFRGDASRGSGVGLYLAKRICDRHGWTIKVKSDPGIGSQFNVFFDHAR